LPTEARLIGRPAVSLTRRCEPAKASPSPAVLLERLRVFLDAKIRPVTVRRPVFSVSRLPQENVTIVGSRLHDLPFLRPADLFDLSNKLVGQFL
jgi:hypothetical protein